MLCKVRPYKLGLVSVREDGITLEKVSTIQEGTINIVFNETICGSPEINEQITTMLNRILMTAITEENMCKLQSRLNNYLEEKTRSMELWYPSEYISEQNELITWLRKDMFFDDY